MRTAKAVMQKSLPQRLMPLVYALVVVVAVILALAWGAMKMQIALAGLLTGESVFSKSEKEAVIALQRYADTGAQADLDSFKRNYAILGYDRWARDAIASRHYRYAEALSALTHGNTIPETVPGIIFMLDHFSWAPYMRDALRDWRSVDESIADFWQVAETLQRDYANGGPSPEEADRQKARIVELNKLIGPPEYDFSIQIAKGTLFTVQSVFAGTLLVACLALILWITMARRTLQRIHGTEQRFQWLFDSMGDAIVIVEEARGRVLGANRADGEWVGRDSHDLIGMRYVDLFVPGSLRENGANTMGMLRDKTGRVRTVETHSSLTTWGGQSVRQASMRDISDRIVLEQERRIASEAMASVAEGVMIADAQRRITSINAAYTHMTGYTLQHLQHRRFDDLRQMPDGSSLPSSIWNMVADGGNWVGEVQSMRADSSSYPELLSISAIRDDRGMVQHYVAVVTDITHSKADRLRLEYMVAHDPLTGLVNRNEFQRHCMHAIQEAGRVNGAVAVLFVDLDAFKAVNDSYSHAMGDRLLVKVAQRIRSELGDNDVAGRIGGDEFTILLGSLRAREQAAQFATGLLQRLSEPMQIGDHEIVVSASIGIAGYPLDGHDPVSLIANADAAMYTAKIQERNAFRFYTPLMHADARMRMVLGADMRQALMKDEFYMVYQPSVELRTGRIVAVEALLRWRHPERGELMPDEFIPLAEDLGLIRRIDAWAMRAVCMQVRHWDQARLPPIRVALNTSAATFGHPGFIDSVKQALQASQIAPERLMFEITESAILRLGETTEQIMHALHAQGISVAIDDFGTGYSSLAYLKLSGINYLKIDRTFITDLPDSSNDVAIVEAMLAIAKSLDICTIAEGIETPAQHDFLLRAGCSEGQGYYYSQGLPASEIERLLSPNPRHEASHLRLVPPKS